MDVYLGCETALIVMFDVIVGATKIVEEEISDKDRSAVVEVERASQQDLPELLCRLRGGVDRLTKV